MGEHAPKARDGDDRFDNLERPPAPVPVVPIRVFAGADCNNSDLESQAVFEYSLRQHASEPVDLTWMQIAKTGPWSGWKTASARTPFSHFRWSIPSVCQYEGRAIYADSDFIFRADIAELWHQDLPKDAILLARNPDGKVRTCCMLFDCAKAKGHIPPVEVLRTSPDAQANVVNYLKAHRELMAPFEGDWNCIDLKGYEDINDPRIKAIHYSRIETQLHLKHAIPRLQAEGRTHWYTGPVGAHWRPELQALFDQLLAEAIAAGYTLDSYRVDPHGPYQKKKFVYATSKVAP
jgi:hypothetical protein